MKDRLLFLRAFARTLCICLAVWAAAMAALVWLNWRWSREDIPQRRMEIPNRIAEGETVLHAYGGLNGGIMYYLPMEGTVGEVSARLTMSSTYTLWPYGGQTALRLYERDGTPRGRSLLFAAYTDLLWEGREVAQYLVFDPVLSEKGQLAAARVLNRYPQLLSTPDGGADDLTTVEATGWVEGAVMYPQKVTLWFGEKQVVLAEADQPLLEGEELVTGRADWLVCYAALAGRGGPERRLTAWRAMEAELDEVETRWRNDLELFGIHQADSSTIYLAMQNPRLIEAGERAVAYTYTLPASYLLYGLEPAILLTLAAAVALACWLTWLETRAIRRERNFTRAAAHELKTPLAVLRSHAEALREDIDPAKRAAYLDVVLDESDRMAALVGQLLDLSRLERGVPLKRERVDFAALVRACFDRLSLSAGERDLHVTLNLTEGMVSGDRARLEEAVGNLASNALRYTPAGGSISVRLENSRGKLWLAVDNDGQGFTPRELSRLWEPFYRGDPARSRDTGGAGLGLAIVRAAVRAHGGTCGAENRAGGVRFWLELPALQSDG